MKKIKEKIAHGRWFSLSGKLLKFIIFAGLLGLAVFLTVWAFRKESILLGAAVIGVLLIDWFFVINPWYRKHKGDIGPYVVIRILSPLAMWIVADRDTWYRRGNIIFGFFSLIVFFSIGIVIGIEAFNSPDWGTRITIIFFALLFPGLGVYIFVRQLKHPTKHSSDDIELRE